MKKALFVLVATAASIAVAVPSASASDADSAASHVVAGGTSAGAVLNGGLTVAYDCTATATGAVVSMAITRCKISTGTQNKTIALPGNTATVAGEESVPLSSYTLCYTATATYVDASTNTASGCNSLVPPVGGGVPTAGVTIN